MKDLNVLRICAILHDIGKPECWAYQRKWTDHIKYTHQLISETLGEEIAETAMRHHWSRYYEPEYYPKTYMERIICLADNIASGADRPEAPYTKKPRPSPPIYLSHPLSAGVAMIRNDAEDLKMASEEIKRILAVNKPVYEENPQQAYVNIYKQLSKTRLVEIPAYTEPPINDISLFDHLRLTTAIATCIILSGGYRGDEAEKYDFCLLSGDADKIKGFIDVSRRLPDLVGGSEMVKQATEEAVYIVRQELGPECVIYHGGGSFLALAPPNRADGILRQAREAFINSTGGQLTITTAKTTGSGEEFGRDFGKIWERANDGVRREKLFRTPPAIDPIPSGTPVCDVCGVRPFQKVDEYVTPIEAAPRADRLCVSCYKRRRLGREKGGIKIDAMAMKDPNRLVGVLKMDGDDVGSVFTGEKLRELKKSMTPARLATLSWLMNRTCEEKLKNVVKENGGECIYAGGDDLVAILPGGKVPSTASEIAEKFCGLLSERVTMSAGFALVKPAHPLYMVLQASTQLLRNAKDEEKKASLDYEIIRGVGYLPQDLNRETRVKRREKALTGRPYKWQVFAKLMALVKKLKRKDFAATQLRTLGKILASPKPERFQTAEYFIKRQVGRGVIPYEDGKMLLDLIKTGQLPDAIELLTVMKEGNKCV